MTAADIDIYELRERGVRVLDSDQCCELACSGGACESCPCCCAGWCVWGHCGEIPNPETDSDNYRIWLETAAEHNPVAKRLLELESAPVFDVRACRVCGCTEDDCSGCVARTGEACSWAEPDLCTACVPAGVRS